MNRDAKTTRIRGGRRMACGTGCDLSCPAIETIGNSAGGGYLPTKYKDDGGCNYCTGHQDCNRAFHVSIPAGIQGGKRSLGSRVTDRETRQRFPGRGSAIPPGQSTPCGMTGEHQGGAGKAPPGWLTIAPASQPDRRLADGAYGRDVGCPLT